MIDILKTLNYEDLLDNFPEPILILNKLGIILHVNDAFIKLMEYSKEEIINENLLKFIDQDYVFESCMKDIEELGYSKDKKTSFLKYTNEKVTLLKNVKLICSNNEDFLFVNLRNISEIDLINDKLERDSLEAESLSYKLKSILSTKEEELVSAQSQLNEVLNAINEIIWYIDDKDMSIQYVSKAVEPIFGVEVSNFMSDSSLWQEMIYVDDQEKVMNFFQNLDENATNSMDFRIKSYDGTIKWLNNRIIYKKNLGIYIGVSYDITQNKKSQDKIEYLAYHDILTSLPNRAYLTQEINKQLKSSSTIKHSFAVLFLDLDNFKYINDSLGHEVGDEVLKSVATRLLDTLSSNVICSRFGGDEFIIIIKNIQNDVDIKKDTNLIIKSMQEPFIVSEHSFFISCSVGISIYPKDASSSSNLLKNADTAMYEAKKAGKNQYKFYTKKMDDQVEEFIHLENIVKEALSNSYFELYFQPLVNSKTLIINGFESLLRLNHPKYGFISPEQFIPVAESSGDILDISKFVLEKSCIFNKKINSISENKYFVAVNVSARQFQEEYFAEKFLKCLKDNDVNPKNVKVELTESIIMDNIDIATKELKILQELGVTTALDDFGTGYSSFEYLAKLPIDTIKIDKSFIINLFETNENKHIVEAMTTLAHTMGKSVVAEGVESLEHAKYIASLDIDYIQGFFISQAIKSQDIFKNFDQREKHYY